MSEQERDTEIDIVQLLDSPAGKVFRELFLIINSNDLPLVVDNDGVIMNNRGARAYTCALGRGTMPERA